jgi:coronin-1B/1C/6
MEPALSASDFFAGKTSRPKVVDLETRAISTSKAPIPAAPSPAPTEPSKSKSAPAAYTIPVKEDPKTFATETEVSPTPSIPAASQKEGLEIVQPDSEDETPVRTPANEESVTGVKVVPEPASNGSVTAVCVSPKDGQLGLTCTQPSTHLLIKKLSSKATAPTRGSTMSAGYDLYSAEDKVVPKRGKALVDTQLSIAVPEGCYGRVAPRSGLGTSSARHPATGADGDSVKTLD